MRSRRREFSSRQLLTAGTCAAAALAVALVVGCAEEPEYSATAERAGSTLAVTSLSPASAAVGTMPQTLTISGSGFLPSSSVTFNGVSHPAAYVSREQIFITLSSTDLQKIGDFSVMVTNPPPGGPSVGAYFRVEGGTLRVEITGLPSGEPGKVLVSSLDGFSATIASTQTLQVPPATYSIVGNGFGAGKLDYYSLPGEQSVRVADGFSGSLQVHYAVRRPTMSALDQGALAIRSMVLAE